MKIENLDKIQLSWEDLKALEGWAIISKGKFQTISIRYPKMATLIETSNIETLRDLNKIITDLLKYLESGK